MHIKIHRRNGESPNWQALVRIGGRRQRFSCRTTNKTTARKYAEQRAAELEARYNRSLVGQPDPIRMSEVFDRYEHQFAPKLRTSARDRMMHVVTQAREWFCTSPLNDPEIQNVTPHEIQAFLEVKQAEGVSARTVNLYRANLHRVFQLCVRPWLLIHSNPVDGTESLRHDAREPVVPSESQFKRLHAACSGQPMLSLFVTLAWETGARTNEMLQLTWDDIDLSARQVTFVNDPAKGQQTKGRRSRTLPLSNSATVALRDHAAAFELLAPRSPYVFKHLRRSRDAEPGQRIERVYRGFKSAAKRIGLPGLRPHDLRHGMVTRKLAEGVPVQLVSKYVGHADLATTMGYTHLVPEHLRSVVAAVAER